MQGQDNGSESEPNIEDKQPVQSYSMNAYHVPHCGFFGLYPNDRAWFRGEIEPEDKDKRNFGDYAKEHPQSYRPAYSIAKPIYPDYRPINYTPRPVAQPDPRYRTPAPRAWTPRPESPSEVAFDFRGQPIHAKGGFGRRPLSELLEPNTSIPWASIVRDPWWWEYPSLRPYVAPYTSVLNTPLPFYLRDSYLSPVKRHFLWERHPIRPFAATY